MSTFLLRRSLARARATQFRSSLSRQPQSWTCIPSPTFSRNFHATRPQKLNVLDPILSTTNSALLTIHHVLPWWATLPLAALTVRFMLLPLTLRSRRLMVKQVKLQPLLNSWRHAIQNNTLKPTSSAPIASAALAQRALLRGMRKKRKELYKMFGCQSYKNFLPPIVQFPLFITVIETIRGLCGTTQGFWRMLLGSDSTPINAPEAIIDAVDNLSDTIVPPSTISQILTADPSMATEGMLWFTDLTAPDPMLILPFMLSATIFLNLIPKHYFSGRPAPTTKPGPIGRGLSMFMKAFALAIGPMTLQIPSAMLLYWISSSGLAFAQGVLLDIFSPIGNPVTPCVPPPSKLMGNAKPETRVRDKVLTKLIEQNGKK